MLHIPIVHAHDVSKQFPLEKKFPSGWKYYKTIVSYVICVFMEILSTWEVWRALKKLELVSAMPRATLMHLLCSPNFLCASYLNEWTLTDEPIVNNKLDFRGESSFPVFWVKWEFFVLVLEEGGRQDWERTKRWTKTNLILKSCQVQEPNPGLRGGKWVLSQVVQCHTLTCEIPFNILYPTKY